MTSMRLLMREPSKPKRDFLRENKRQVKKIEEQFRENKAEDNRLHLRTGQKYANIQPKVQTRNHQFPSRPASAYPTSTSSEAFSQQSRRPVSSAYALSEAATYCDEAVQCCEESILKNFNDCRDKGTQTDDGGSEGKVMMPSACPWEQRSQLRLNLAVEDTAVKAIDECLNQATQRTASSGSGPKTSGWNLATNSGDIKETPNGPVARSYSTTKEVPSERINPLSKANSAETLSQLRATQDKLVYELNNLPVRSTTLRAQKRRQEIDLQLDKVEALIAALTKPF